MNKTISIIGAGISGMTAGIYLQEHGYDVTIYERNANPGGYCTGWSRKGQWIDGCIHWMIGSKDGTRLNKVWKHVGALEGVNIINPDSFYKVVYEGKTLTFYSDVDKLEKELLSHSEGDDELITDFVNAIRNIGIFETPSDVPFEYCTTMEMLHSMRPYIKNRKFLEITVKDYAEKYHSGIIRFALQHSLVDKEFSVFYLLMTLANFCNKNADVPEGGSLAVAKRMADKFVSLGGKIEYRADVSKIMVENDVAKGIVVNGKNVYSDYVVSGADVHFTYEKLLEGKYPCEPYHTYDADKVHFPTYSLSLLSYRTRLDLSKEDVDIVAKINPVKCFGKEHEYVSFRHYGYDKSLQHDGYTTVEVLVRTLEEDFDYMKSLSREEYNAMKKEMADAYLRVLKDYFKSDDFELIDAATPVTFNRYVNSYKGTFMSYPLVPKANQVMAGNAVKDVENLYIANQWLVMPGGTCVAATMGKFAAQYIMKKDGMEIRNLD